MRILLTSATKLSQVSIDQDLDMGTPGYDIKLGGQLLKTTNLALKEDSSSTLAVRNAADNAYKYIKVSRVYVDASIRGTGNFSIDAENTDGRYIHLRARDTGAGLVEIARLVGAADPYFQATLPMVLNPSTDPATIVEGHFFYDSGDDRLTYRDAGATQKVAPVATGTYTGDGGTAGRQITVGFLPKLVILKKSGTVRIWIIEGQDSDESVKIEDNPIRVTYVHIHASDGFVVGDGGDEGNVNGVTYYWVAFG